MIAPPEYSIVISPIGDLDTSLLKQVSTRVNRRFGYRTETIRLLQDVEFAMNLSRNQYHSTLILERLASKAPSHAIKVLAICEVDLFIPILTHVYGEAQLGGKACVISTYRLQVRLSSITAHETYRERVEKEAIHELGHTFNLRHCPDQSCGMHYCRSVKDVDRKLDQFCRYCNILLEDEIKRLTRK